MNIHVHQASGQSQKDNPPRIATSFQAIAKSMRDSGKQRALTHRTTVDEDLESRTTPPGTFWRAKVGVDRQGPPFSTAFAEVRLTQYLLNALPSRSDSRIILCHSPVAFQRKAHVETAQCRVHQHLTHMAAFSVGRTQKLATGRHVEKEITHSDDGPHRTANGRRLRLQSAWRDDQSPFIRARVSRTDR